MAAKKAQLIAYVQYAVRQLVDEFFAAEELGLE